ncbi:hypothetical protein EZV62_011337 [Acer yangbiense]|uniref:F-box associated beta-propeller type 1 domain-containing protein n=1 Tax=Acer yangbiense TaxID=1000413 RepID=A0A5C7I477_9ROSI|nr:hypothetical protein EZV62_011337 [Acer yangbiense]
MVGSVNGLLCLSPFFRQFGRTLYLWNPSIWKVKILDASCFHHRFDKRKTRSAVGFHHKTKDYKIVKIMYFHDIYRAYVEKEPPRVEVFSLARNSWREVGTHAGCCVRDDRSMVVVNGRVHWFAKRTKDASDSQSHGYELEVSVAVLRESLALIVSCYKKHLIGCCNIWVMKEYGLVESWRVFSYDLDKQEYKPLGFAEYLDDLVPFRESLVLYVQGSCLTPRKNLLVEGGTFREEEEQ